MPPMSLVYAVRLETVKVVFAVLFIVSALLHIGGCVGLSIYSPSTFPWDDLQQVLPLLTALSMSHATMALRWLVSPIGPVQSSSRRWVRTAAAVTVGLTQLVEWGLFLYLLRALESGSVQFPGFATYLGALEVLQSGLIGVAVAAWFPTGEAPDVVHAPAGVGQVQTTEQTAEPPIAPLTSQPASPGSSKPTSAARE